MDLKLKYIRCKRFNEIIVFPELLEHSNFQGFEPISAGFCWVDTRKMQVKCYGESVSLKLKSHPEADSYWATKYFFGEDAAEEMITRQPI